MNFVVKRTQDYETDKPPCEGAYPTVVTVTDTLYCGSNYDGAKDGYWHREGRNHRQDDAYLIRDLDVTVWLIDLEWADMEAFIARYGSIVIEPWDRDEKRLLLEIYDGWRE